VPGPTLRRRDYSGCSEEGEEGGEEGPGEEGGEEEGREEEVSATQFRASPNFGATEAARERVASVGACRGYRADALTQSPE
jgi:hypothetical protein